MKHNPFAYFRGIRDNPDRCARVAPFSEFAGDLAAGKAPDYAFIVPDMCNDGHDCSLATVDRWLSEHVPAILASPAWQDSGLLIVTFDEGDTKDGCCGTAAGGRVVTILLSPLVTTGATSDLAYTHYSVLSTIAEGLGIAAPGDAVSTAPITDVWTTLGP
jgi:hypothetical protein